MEEYPIKIEKNNTYIDKKNLTKYVWSFVIGDGCLILGHNKNRPNRETNASFVCSQIAEHEDYILWRANILSHITSIHLSIRKGVYINTCKPQIKTVSNRHPFFTTIRDRMYLYGNKIIDPHYLKLLDWEALSILYQDDGSLSKKPIGQNCYSLVLSTEGFSYGDNVLLQRAIKDKTDVLFGIVRVNTKSGLHYRLQTAKYSNIKIFLNGVSKYIKPSFEYKLLPNVQLHKNVDGDII